jgi:probable rRNA maturation factor
MGRRQKQQGNWAAQNAQCLTSKSPRIHLSNRQKDLKIYLPAITKIVLSVLELEKIFCHEVSVYFVTEKEISALHARFFDDPSPTDCISFPIDGEVLGDVFVCPQTAIHYANSHKLNRYEELALYIIHGLLHLIGYEDTEPAKKRCMRKKEKKCMAHCKPFVNLLTDRFQNNIQDRNLKQ